MRCYAMHYVLPSLTMTMVACRERSKSCSSVCLHCHPRFCIDRTLHIATAVSTFALVVPHTIATAMASSASPFSCTGYYNPADSPDAALLCKILHRATGFGSDLTLEKVLLLLLTNLHEINSAASPTMPAVVATPDPSQSTAQEWAKEQLYLHFGAVRANIACVECKRAKRKCISSSPNGGCDTCLRKGIPCVPRSTSEKKAKRKSKESVILPKPENKRLRLSDSSALGTPFEPLAYGSNGIRPGGISEQIVDFSASQDSGIENMGFIAAENFGNENTYIPAFDNFAIENMDLSSSDNFTSENMDLSGFISSGIESNSNANARPAFPDLQLGHEDLNNRTSLDSPFLITSKDSATMAQLVVDTQSRFGDVSDLAHHDIATYKQGPDLSLREQYRD
ncbi:hypothetical protein HII31_13029 [Pseudocercospora fuligena]|uniref:Zn(2)-C6 fungal-type domain-containing protein n=1 Tax=Pseudocercospora fuligena TaxID=685502 RepID=A0A8H6R5R6_9PEZI|nr:hypothetical protein HII31_13029 [Pseudocercospora fuligena]